MRKIFLFFYLLLFHVACAWCMQPITQELIEEHKQAFTNFVNETRNKINMVPRPASWMPSWTNSFMNKALKSSSKILGYASISLEDIQFLDRFFENKKMIKKAIETLVENEKTIQHITAIFQELSEKEQCNKDDLVPAIDKQTKERLDPGKVQEKNGEGVYVIADDIYFNCAACNLFAVYLFENDVIKLKSN